MKKLIGIYCLLVCFFTIGCFTITLGIGVNKMIGYYFETKTNSDYLYEQKFQQLPIKDQNLIKDNQFYKNYSTSLKVFNRLNNNINSQTEKMKRIETILKYFVILFIDSILFYCHWRIISNLRKEEKN